MAARFVFVVILLCFFSIFTYVASNGEGEYVKKRNPFTVLGQPWPMPQTYQPTSDILTLNYDTFEFHKTGANCDILDLAFKRYFMMIFYPDRETHSLKFRPHTAVDNAILDRLDVNVGTCSDKEYPALDSDESYELSIQQKSGASLNAKTVWGALRGLETFSQLIYETGDSMKVINVTHIDDFPRFSHRGILLDTSRHYIAKEFIMQTIEAMAQNKLNVFHWHIVDDPSFPYQSKAFPAMSQQGAFDPYTHIYTQEDVAEIIEFARVRGVRVVPEFDTPGHTQSWGLGVPGLLTKCYSKGKFTGQYGPIDPSINTTYEFLSEFLKELIAVFPDKYIHLGGDEVSFNCWKSNPQISLFMNVSGFANNYSKLEEYYEKRLLDIINSFGTNTGYIIWQEVIDNKVKVKSDTVVHVWKGGYQDELARVTKLGYTALLSSCWYLNYIKYGADWKTYYACDPQKFNGTDAQKKLVIGGEACMWGEMVDGTNVVSRLWPRASAVAERLWSPATYTDANKAQGRFEEMRCRMLRRGINAEPMNGPSFCKYEAKSELPAYMLN